MLHQGTLKFLSGQLVKGITGICNVSAATVISPLILSNPRLFGSQILVRSYGNSQYLDLLGHTKWASGLGAWEKEH